MRVRPYMTLENKVDGAVLVLIDITDLKRAEEAKARLPGWARFGARWLPRDGMLAKLLARCGDGIHLNPHMEGEIGASIFQHACKLGLKGIVSKHRDGAYVKKPERNEWRRA